MTPQGQELLDKGLVIEPEKVYKSGKFWGMSGISAFNGYWNSYGNLIFYYPYKSKRVKVFVVINEEIRKLGEIQQGGAVMTGTKFFKNLPPTIHNEKQLIKHYFGVEL